jgi:hypothetical protein
MAFGDDVLGTSSLPPLLPGPVGWAPPGITASLGDFSTGGSIDVPLTSDAAAVAPSAVTAAPAARSTGATGGIDLNQILGLLRPQQQRGFNTPLFMSPLGAGLSSAGQNWNKPGLAAFASGAGAALQGGQQWQQQQQKDRQTLVQLALHAWQIGDMATYHQALINLRAANARNRAPTPGAPPAPPPISPDTREPSSAVPAPIASGDPAASPAHRIALDVEPQ